MTEYSVVLPLANFEFHETPCSGNHTYEPEGIFLHIFSSFRRICAERLGTGNVHKNLLNCDFRKNRPVETILDFG